MLKEHIIGAESASIIGNPKEIREYIKRVGEDKFIIYGFPGFLVADSIDKATSERIAKASFKDVSYIPKPLGTIYCTDGTYGATTITDGFDIAKLAVDIEGDDFLQVISEITDRKTYFIGEGIAGTHKGAFTALADYYNNLLSREELKKYKMLFNETEGELRLTKEGEDVLELFKETWDYTPREVRSLCKLDIRPLISKLFGDLNEDIPLDLEYVKNQMRGEATPDKIKDYLREGIEKLKRIISEGSMQDNHKDKYILKRKGVIRLDVLESQLRYEGVINNEIDIEEICDALLTLVPDVIRPQAKGLPQVPRHLLDAYHPHKEWRDDLERTISVLRTYATQIRLYSIDPIRQLKLLEKGGFVRLDKSSRGDSAGHIMIYKGHNFKQINDVGGAFCPIGLSEKWNTWKIERLGRDITVTKYFRNYKGDLLRVSANNYGGVKIEGSAEPVFDSKTVDEINSIESVLNYGLDEKERAAFEFTPVTEEIPEPKSKPEDARSKKSTKKPRTPRVTGTGESNDRLLKRIKKFKKY